VPAAGATAGVLLVLGGPAVGPAAAATPSSGPAAPPTTTDQPGPDSWQPPPVNPALAPSPTIPPGPTAVYTRKNACITSSGGATITAIPPAQTMLNLKAAQELSTGKGVTVAVIDTGVNQQQPLLAGRVTGGGDYVDNSGGMNGTIDCDGHGTLTAGIVAADTRNDPQYGFIGVAPDAHILAMRQTSTAYQGTNPDGSTSTAGSTLALAEAITRAVNTPGVGVITMSVDQCLPETMAAADLVSPVSGDPQLQAAVHYAVEHNVVVVNSAGNIPSAPDNGQGQSGGSNDPCQNVPQNDNANPNDVKQVEIPAIYADDVLSVASVDPLTGSVSSFSEWGPWVSVAAPGEDIVSVDPAGSGLANTLAEQGNQTGPIQGTSFAAPYVAGLAALIRSKFPNLTARQVMTRIESTAQHPSGPGGRNNQVGYGIIDPVAALTAIIPGQNGVPAAKDRTIPATLPHAAARDWHPMQVALIALGCAIALLAVTAVVTRTRRHDRARP
jgi:membrane-anchored mycosin MYCP